MSHWRKDDWNGWVPKKGVGTKSWWLTWAWKFTKWKIDLNHCQSMLWDNMSWILKEQYNMSNISMTCSCEIPLEELWGQHMTSDLEDIYIHIYSANVSQIKLYQLRWVSSYLMLIGCFGSHVCIWINCFTTSFTTASITAHSIFDLGVESQSLTPSRRSTAGIGSQNIKRIGCVSRDSWCQWSWYRRNLKSVTWHQIHIQRQYLEEIPVPMLGMHEDMEQNLHSSVLSGQA